VRALYLYPCICLVPATLSLVGSRTGPGWSPPSWSTWGEWRNMGLTSSEGASGEQGFLGSDGGLPGFLTVLRRVQVLLGEDASREMPFQSGLQPPKTSILGRDVADVEEYEGAIWDWCRTGTESVLVSLYLFMALWQAGMGSASGFNP